MQLNNNKKKGITNISPLLHCGCDVYLVVWHGNC